MGITYAEDPIEYNLKVIDKLDPDSTASMQKDIAKGHESEIQGLLFDMIALGEKMDVDMPTYRKVAQNSMTEYTVSHSLESRYRNLFHFRHFHPLLLRIVRYRAFIGLLGDIQTLPRPKIPYENLIPCSFTACWVLLSVLAWDIVCSMSQAIGSLTL